MIAMMIANTTDFRSPLQTSMNGTEARAELMNDS